MKIPENLLDELIRFIRNEREAYGDFSAVPDASDEDDAEINEKDSATPDLDQETISSPADQKIGENTVEATPPSSPDDTEQAEPGASKTAAPKSYSDCYTLEELEAWCEICEDLKTDLEGTRLVFGVGNPTAELMLIGEAPGAEEDKQGEPFVGAAGQLLNDILKAIDIDREEVYIANILKHRPPNNRNPLPEEREQSLPILMKQIELVDPKLILSLGKVATQTLLDRNDSLTRMRGNFHEFHGRQLLATYHPAALLRNPKWKRPTWEDVQLLKGRLLQ